MAFKVLDISIIPLESTPQLQSGNEAVFSSDLGLIGMHCNVRHHNRGSLCPVCSHSSCWLWENMKEEAKTRVAKKRTLQRRTWNNLSQYYKTQNAYFHSLLTHIQYETPHSTVPLNPWAVIIYSDRRRCMCIYHSFLLHTSPIKNHKTPRKEKTYLI